MTAKKKPLLVAFVGTSGSGKTTTMEYLTAQLTNLGFKVGVAKHIHEEGFTIDTEGKDTWRHARAGARIVIGASPNEVAVIKKKPRGFEFKEIISALNNPSIDIGLLEGFSDLTRGIAKLPKIIAAKNTRDFKQTLRRTKPPILAVTGPITRQKFRNAPAPLIDMTSDGFLLTSIIRRLLRPNETKEMLGRAAKKHGGACIGLAVGIRAAFIASNIFGQKATKPKKIVCGTKHCIAEAFRTIYPHTQVQMDKVGNDRVMIESRGAKLMLQLTPKKKTAFTRIADVLNARDNELFDSIVLSRVRKNKGS